MLNKNYITRYSRRWFKAKKIGNLYPNIFIQKIDDSEMNYKNIPLLSKFINSQGQIMNAVFNKLTSRQQSIVSSNIKRARYMGLISNIISEQKVVNKWQKDLK